MYGSSTASSVCRKTAGFNAPVKRTRSGEYKIPSGKIVFTCFTSDFLLEDADEWRSECWSMMRERSDCLFYFFTKRIERLESCIPADWGSGYDNVMIGCTVENQAMADFRLPIFLSLPVKHRSIIVAPMLEAVDLKPYLNSSIEQVAVSGESGKDARPLDYQWVLDVREQCIESDIPFQFHQTGAHFIKNGRLYNVSRRYQIAQAKKAGIDFRMRPDGIPETAVLPRPFSAPHDIEQYSIEDLL